MIGQGKPAHYLRPNHSSWTPPAVIGLDSETRTVQVEGGEAEVLRCWAARMVRRRHRRRAGEVLDADGFTPQSAAEAIDAWASADKTSWLYAHNVGFDLVTTGLPAELARLGWELSSSFALSGNSPWLVMHKGRQVTTETRSRDGHKPGTARVKWQHTLTITDSYSLFPVPLVQLSADAGVPKPPLPADDDPPELWLARCRADVQIMMGALLTLMDWWEDHDLGRFGVSGSTCGWRTYRHRIEAGEVVIDPDQTAVDFEREAVYGGRRDAWRTGELPEGRYIEADYSAAYPTIAAELLLPSRRIGPLTPQIAAAILRRRARYGMVARCVIETDQPRWPLRVLGRVFYPVGRFETVLATPELQSAFDAGCLVEVGAGWFYAMSGHMQPWARWVLAIAAAGDDDVPYPVRVAAKNWARAAIGKWAQHGFSRMEIPGPPSDDWAYEDCAIAGVAGRATLTTLGGHRYLSIADQMPDDPFPAILAHVEAEVRSRLARVIEAAPPGAVVQCDTDGIMLDAQLAEAWLADYVPALARDARPGAVIDAWMTSASTLSAPLSMREKTAYRRLTVHGPQHIELDGKPRMAGVSRGAWKTYEGAWMTQLWPSLAWQLAEATPGQYERPYREVRIAGPYVAGWVLADGAVRPVETFIDAAGDNQVRPWQESSDAAAGCVLGPKQADWSVGLCPTPTN